VFRGEAMGLNCIVSGRHTSLFDLRLRAFDIASAKDEEFGSWLETFLRGEN